MKKTIETEIGFEDFKIFTIFEIYYQLMIGLDLDKRCKKSINYLMNYHFRKVYSKDYNKKVFDLVGEKYICVATLEKN